MAPDDANVPVRFRLLVAPERGQRVILPSDGNANQGETGLTQQGRSPGAA